VKFKVKNPWGASIDVQRSDLWSLELDQVLSLLNNPVGVNLSDEYKSLMRNFPSSNEALASARKVTLPEDQIAARTVIQGSGILHLPGYDEPISPVRVDFLHEVDSRGVMKSKIYSMLYAWLLLSRAGQQKFGAKTDMSLVDARKRVVFTADVRVQFHAGSGPDSNNPPALSRNSALTLKRCWISDLQLGDLDYDVGNSLLVVTATLHPAAVVPSPQSGTAIRASNSKDQANSLIDP
jgi:hypothetical protein